MPYADISQKEEGTTHQINNFVSMILWTVNYLILFMAFTAPNVTKSCILVKQRQHCTAWFKITCRALGEIQMTQFSNILMKTHITMIT